MLMLLGRCLWDTCSSASESILSMGVKVGLRHVDRQEVGIYISLVFNDNLSAQGHLRSRWDRTTDHWLTQPTWLSLVIHITSAQTPPNPRLIEGGRRVARLNPGWVWDVNQSPGPKICQCGSHAQRRPGRCYNEHILRFLGHKWWWRRRWRRLVLSQSVPWRPRTFNIPIIVCC